MKRFLYLLLLLILVPVAGTAECSAASTAACSGKAYPDTGHEEKFFETDLYGNDEAIIETSFNPFAASPASQGRTKRNVQGQQPWAGMPSAATPEPVRSDKAGIPAHSQTAGAQAKSGRTILSLFSRLII